MRRERTQIIIDRLKNRPNEFTALHAILCMTHGWENADCVKFHKCWLDMSMIAIRLDELNSR